MYLTHSAHVPEGCSSHLVCRSVNIGSQRSLCFKPLVKYQIKVGNVLRGNDKTTFSSFSLVFEKKATELRLWGHAQSSTHPVLFGKLCDIVVLPPGLHDFSIPFL